MREIIAELDRFSAGNAPVALATVVGVVRSAPRPVGAKLAVSARGEIAGSVSGGCVEAAVVQEAERVLNGASPGRRRFGIPDDAAWDAGLPCGGEIEVWIERYAPGSFAQLVREGRRGAQVTLLEGPRAGQRIVVEASSEDAGAPRIDGSFGSPELDASAAAAAEDLAWLERSELRGPLFYDVAGPDPRLILFGAVDIAAAVCRIARVCGWRTFVVDPRTRFATRERFPDAEAVIAAWPAEALRQLGGIDPATSIAVLTHDPKLDDAALALALRSPARYVGAMGSRASQRARRERLLGAGLTELELARLSGPIGLDLGAIGREETALSIMAEIVAARHGRSGGRLIDAAGRIHQVPSA